MTVHADRRHPTTEPASSAAPPSSGGATGIVRSAIGVGIATTAASGANYLSNVLLGRSLGPDDFADAALVVSALLLLSALALGFQLTVARALAGGAGQDRFLGLRRRATLTGLAIGSLISVSSPLLADVFNMASPMPMLLLGVSVPLFFLLAVTRGAVQAQHAFGRLALSLAIEAAVRLMVIAVVVWFGFGASGVAIALSVSFLAGLAPCTGIDASLSTQADATVQRTAVAATALLLVGQVVISNSDIWIVAARVPDEAGLYAAIALIGRLVFIAAWSVVTVVFPSLVSQPDARRALLWWAAAAIGAFGAVLSALATLLGERLITSMMGGAYAHVGHLLGPYALATTLFVVANLFAVAGVARGEAAAPALMAIGAALQVIVLSAGAARGISWVVDAQVVLMATLVLTIVARELWAERRRPGHP